MPEQTPRQRAAEAVLSTLNGLIPGAAEGETTVEVAHGSTMCGRPATDTWRGDAHGFAERIALVLDVAVLQPLYNRIAELEGEQREQACREKRAALLAHIEKAEMADNAAERAALPELRQELADLEAEASAAEAPFTEARAAFMQIGRTPSLEGLRAELRIEGWPMLTGRYAGASMGRMHDVPGHEHLLSVEPSLIFEFGQDGEG